MPSTCRNCCCGIRSGQQVLMCSVCGDFVHLRCLSTMNDEETETAAAQIRWECGLCTVRRIDEEAKQLIRVARQRKTDERLDELVNRVMILSKEQETVRCQTFECSSSIVRRVHELEELEKCVGDLDGATDTSTEPVRELPSVPPPKLRHKMVLSNLGAAASSRRRSDAALKPRLPQMNLALGFLISQLIFTNCD